MSRTIRTTEFLNESFGVKVDHEDLLSRGSMSIYRVSFGKKSTYVDNTSVTLEQLKTMKDDIDKVLELCEKIKLDEELLATRNESR